jgi:hypothetical protein
MNISTLIAGGANYAANTIYENKVELQNAAGEGYAYGKNIALGLGTAGMIVPNVGKLQAGAMFSFGAEPVTGQRGFGFVTGPNSIARGPQNLSQAVIMGEKGLFTPSGLFGTMEAQSMSHLDKVRGIGNEVGKGVMRQTIMSSLLPIGMTAWFAADAYANDGIGGLGKYMAADALGNYYGTQQSLFTATVSDATAATTSLNNLKRFGRAQANVQGTLSKGDFVSRITPMLGSGMLGRMMPTVGGIMGATVGMEVGATIGSFATSMMGYGMDDKIGSFAGGFLGAVGGAKLGAYALSSLPRLGLVGAGIMATTAIVSNTMSAVEAGFSNIGKGRGLNYASDTAAYFTQNAVTMRQRAVQAMHKSHLNARSAFGQEASLMHMNRDMFSHYKRTL